MPTVYCVLYEPTPLQYTTIYTPLYNVACFRLHTFYVHAATVSQVTYFIPFLVIYIKV